MSPNTSFSGNNTTITVVVVVVVVVVAAEPIPGPVLLMEGARPYFLAVPWMRRQQSEELL